MIKDNPSKFEDNPLLDFYYYVNPETSEIRTTNRQGKIIIPYRNAYFKSLEFRIYDTGTITLSGSLHKFYNSGAHNYNDFNLKAFLGVLNDLKELFDINLENCIIKCLEIGVNIIPPIPTNHFLDYCFLHKTLPFENKINSDEGKYKQVKHQQYIIKIYNKALHYKKDFDIKTEIMRFEIKYTKMQRLNKRGIYNLQDLANYDLHKFKDELLNEFNNILFFDTTIKSNKPIISSYNNPIYWLRLLDNDKKNNLFNYHRKQLRKITSTNSENIQFQTSEIMSKKIDLLNSDTTQINTLNILLNCVVAQNEITSKNILCQVTGLNISMQKNNSILLSHTGLKYYYKTDKKIFNELKRKYLTNQWIKSDFDTQIKEIAHNIRNTKSNQQIKQKRIYKPQQVNMLNLLRL